MAVPRADRIWPTNQFAPANLEQQIKALSSPCVSRLAVLAAALLAQLLPAARADDPPAAAGDQPLPSRVHVSSARVDLPNVRVVRADGREIALRDDLNDGRPVVLNFIYTSCTTTCPLLSQVFAEFSKRLGPEHSQVHLVSISIDPEQDRPRELRAYAARYHADANWEFLTGTWASSLAIQRAFYVDRGDKMSHTPVTFIRSTPGLPWSRIDGLVTPGQLLQSLTALLAAR